jgi:hypothetical protein
MSAPALAKATENSGYRLEKHELAALATLPGLSLLSYVDGGMGLVAVAEPLGMGEANLVRRGLLSTEQESDGSPALSEFLVEFRSRLNGRTTMTELHVNDAAVPFVLSHWWIASERGSIIVKTEVRDGRLNYWLGLAQASVGRTLITTQARLRDLPQPRFAAAKSAVILDQDQDIQLRAAIISRDSEAIRDVIQQAHAGHVFARTLAQDLSGPFAGFTLFVEQRTSSDYSAQQIVWLVSEPRAYLRETRMDGSVKFSATDLQEVLDFFNEHVALP